MSWLRGVLLAALLCTPVLAQAPLPPPAQSTPSQGTDVADHVPRAEQIRELRHAVERLPVAVALACVLALRLRRRGTPRRQAPVIQTQIIPGHRRGGRDAGGEEKKEKK
jgi:hypothetical protein